MGRSSSLALCITHLVSLVLSTVVLAQNAGDVKVLPPGAATLHIEEESGSGLPMRYSVSLFNPAQHLLHVRMQLPPGASVRELQLPVWNALYQVRDFAQYVNWIRAATSSGRVLPITQVNKSRWRLAGAEDGARVEYEVYANSSGPFGAQLNSRHCFLNLAEILMYSDDLRQRKAIVDFDAPAQAWRFASTMAQVSGRVLVAENYDQLVDSPVEMGPFEERDFVEAGGHYRIIVDAEASTYDMDKLTAIVRKIVAAETSWMKDRPFDTYTFIYHFPHGAGSGMEHAYGTAIEVSKEAMAGGYGSVAAVTAHEFFHLWNVKRIRPEALEPPDYTRENYTRALWFSEGVTSTVEWIGLLRSGLIEEGEYRRELAAAIGELQHRSAHRTQSAEESSLDAWLEGDNYYGRPERSISYYNKGELLGVLLDLAVREASHGRASLREVFLWMNDNYAKKSRGFADSDDVRKAAEAVSGADLRWLFEKYVAGTEEVPWNVFFRTVGLRLEESKRTMPDAGFAAWRNFDGPLVVGDVVPGGPAEQAGMREGDQILAVNGHNSEDSPGAEISAMKPGQEIVVRLSGDSAGAREVRWKIGGRDETVYELKDEEKVTPSQLARRSAWLKGEAETGDAGR